MKKIHSVLYIKLSKVLSNAYDKTGLVKSFHQTATKRRWFKPSSCKLILSYRALLPISQTGTIQSYTKAGLK